MSTLKDRCRAVVHLDRAEVAAEDARREFSEAVYGGSPVRGYWIAYELALNALAGARSAVDRVRREMRLSERR